MSFREKNLLSLDRRNTRRHARGGWLRGLLFDDWGLRLLALVIAIGLWVGVTGQRQPATMRVRGVPLAFLLPEDMEISDDPRETVEVTLSGEKGKLDGLNTRDLVVSADVRSYREGDRVARLMPGRFSIELPDGVRVERIEPNNVPLKLERRVEREIEVVANLTGEPAEGFVVNRTEVLPERIRVRGPESHVNRLERVNTESVSLDGREENFVVEGVAIEIEDEKVVALESAVTVRVRIGNIAQMAAESTSPTPSASPASLASPALAPKARRR